MKVGTRVIQFLQSFTGEQAKRLFDHVLKIEEDVRRLAEIKRMKVMDTMPQLDLEWDYDVDELPYPFSDDEEIDNEEDEDGDVDMNEDEDVNMEEDQEMPVLQRFS